jgi:hypothetical protein
MFLNNRIIVTTANVILIKSFILLKQFEKPIQNDSKDVIFAILHSCFASSCFLYLSETMQLAYIQNIEKKTWNIKINALPLHPCFF